MPTERIEDYLEALNVIIKKKGYAKVKDISLMLQVSPPSVTEMFQRLQKQGYINYEKYSGVTLTEKGVKVAEKTQKKHVIICSFLETLGVPHDIANDDACRIEHIIHPKTLSYMEKFVSFIDLHEESLSFLTTFKQYYKTDSLKNKTQR